MRSRNGGLVFRFTKERGFELDVSQVGRLGRHRYLPRIVKYEDVFAKGKFVRYRQFALLCTVRAPDTVKPVLQDGR